MQERTNTNLYMSKEIHQKLKLLALKKGETMTVIIERALEKELALIEQELQANDRNKRK